MTMWEFLGWTAVVCLAVVMVAATVAVVVGVVQSVRKPAAKSESKRVI